MLFGTFRKYRAGAVTAEFERIIFNYGANKRFVENKLLKQIEAFTQYAVSVFSEQELPIKPITPKDFRNVENFFNWFKDVSLSMYVNKMLRIEEVREILTDNMDITTQYHFIELFLPFFEEWLHRVLKGENINKQFVMLLGTYILNTVGYKPNLTEIDVIPLWRKMTEISKSLRERAYPITEVEEFKGVRYSKIREGPGEFLELQLDDIITMEEMIYHGELIHSITLDVTPRKFNDVITESCIVIPVRQLGKEELNSIFDVLLPSVEHSKRKDIKRHFRTLILNGFFDREKLCLIKTKDNNIICYKLA